MNIVDYEFFLEHKHENRRDYRVRITCEKCGKASIESWQSLKDRNKEIRYKAICHSCVLSSKSRKHLRGTYYDIKFDSSYELGFIHHCIKSGISIRRCDKSIRYDGKTYTPDFIINDSTIIEIKGQETDESRTKAEIASQQFDYELLNKSALLKLKHFILCEEKRELFLFNQDELKIASMPKGFKDEIPKDFGFVYILSNKLDKAIEIFHGKLTQENLDKLKQNYDSINIACYGEFEYDLIHKRNLLLEKLNNFPRTQTEEEKILYVEKYKALNSGSNNPMYQQYWSDEKKKQVSDKLKGKNAGSKNGMYGKQGTNFGNSGVKSNRSYDYLLFDKNNNQISYFQNTALLIQFLKISKSELMKVVDKDILVNNEFYVRFTERSKQLRTKHANQPVAKFVHKGRSCKLFSFDNKLIKEFSSISEARKELAFDHHNIKDNKLVLKDGGYLIFAPKTNLKIRGKKFKIISGDKVIASNFSIKQLASHFNVSEVFITDVIKDKLLIDNCQIEPM